MDKKSLLGPSLRQAIPGMLEVVQKHSHISFLSKADGSPVTQLDLDLSHFLKDLVLSRYPQMTFYSEEDHEHWNFPMVVVDPLDGTREYIQGRDEWSISVGHLPNDEWGGEGWIFNPKTLECFDSPLKRDFVEKKVYVGEVSRSEWEKSLYQGISSSQFQLNPLGSVAYKLGRLSQGKIDFVVSLWPKSIWDIAAGTILCHEAGMKFYSCGKEVTDVKKRYDPPLIWCHEELFSGLSKLFP